MSKYDRLWNWIRDNGMDKFSLTYAEIEKISMKEQKVMFEKAVE